MLRRLLLAIVHTAALLIAVQPLRAAQEEYQERIVAVGDLHGDYDAWRRIASGAGLTDPQGNWSGGTTTLVQLGDVTDRGPYSLKIIRHLQQLQAQAHAAGGKIIVLLGNHESMNVIGDLRYVHPGEYAAFVDDRSEGRREETWRANRKAIEAAFLQSGSLKDRKDLKQRWFDVTPLGKLEHRRAWEPGGELGRWAASLPAVVKLGRTLFAHGGLSIERARRSLDAINQELSAALASGDPGDQTKIEDRLAPLWYRGNIMRSEEDAGRLASDKELAEILAYHGADRLVIGHTPATKGIEATAQGRLIRVDTGISAYYKGIASYLEIRGNSVRAFELGANGQWAGRPIDD